MGQFKAQFTKYNTLAVFDIQNGALQTMPVQKFRNALFTKTATIMLLIV